MAVYSVPVLDSMLGKDFHMRWPWKRLSCKVGYSLMPHPAESPTVDPVVMFLLTLMGGFRV